MKSLSISGASTKIPAIAGASIEVVKNQRFSPDVIVGTSAGAIFALPLALGMYKEIEEWTTSFESRDIFSVPPVNKKGKISMRALLRIVRGKSSLGKQDRLIKTLSKIITEERFEKYVKGNEADVYLGVVEFSTGRRDYIKVRNVSYSLYLKFVLASSSIPVFVESVEIGGNYYYDGGVRDHIGSHWLMERMHIKENVSIYSRPKNFGIANGNWKPGNIANVLERTVSIMNIEISKNDEQKENMLAREKKIKNRQIFMPAILSDIPFEIDKDKLKNWFEIGKQQAKNKT